MAAKGDKSHGTDLATVKQNKKKGMMSVQYKWSQSNNCSSITADVRNTSSYVFVQFLQAFHFFLEGGGGIYMNWKFDQGGQIFHNVLGFLICLPSVKVFMYVVLGGRGGERLSGGVDKG